MSWLLTTEYQPNYAFKIKVVSPVVGSFESAWQGVYVFYTESGKKYVVKRSDAEKIKEIENLKERKIKVKYIFPVLLNGEIDWHSFFAKKVYILKYMFNLQKFDEFNFKVLHVEFKGNVSVRGFIEGGGQEGEPIEGTKRIKKGSPVSAEIIEPGSEIYIYVWYNGEIKERGPKVFYIGRWKKFGFGKTEVEVIDLSKMLATAQKNQKK